MLEQRARADTDWAEKLAAKQREKLRAEGEGLASSARAGRGTAVEDAVSRRLNPMARKGGVAEAAEAAMRAAKRAPEQGWTRKGKEEMRRQAQERKAAKKAKAKARNKQAEAEEARATEQTQVEVAGSSGSRGTETGEVHVYTGRARRASRRATSVG